MLNLPRVRDRSSLTVPGLLAAREEHTSEDLPKELRQSATEAVGAGDSRNREATDRAQMVNQYMFLNDPVNVGVSRGLGEDEIERFGIFSGSTATPVTLDEADYLAERMDERRNQWSEGPEVYIAQEEHHVAEFHRTFPGEIGITSPDVHMSCSNSGTETNHTAIQISWGHAHKLNKQRALEGKPPLKGILFVEYPESASRMAESAMGGGTYLEGVPGQYVGKQLAGLHHLGKDPQQGPQLVPVYLSAAQQDGKPLSPQAHIQSCQELVAFGMENDYLVVLPVVMNKRGGVNGDLDQCMQWHREYGNQVLVKYDLCQDPRVEDLDTLLKEGVIIQTSTGKRLATTALFGVTLYNNEHLSALRTYLDALQTQYGYTALPNDLADYTTCKGYYPPELWDHPLLTEMNNPNISISIKIDSWNYLVNKMKEIDPEARQIMNELLAQEMREVIANSMAVEEDPHPSQRTNKLINIAVIDRDGTRFDKAKLALLHRLLTDNVDTVGNFFQILPLTLDVKLGKFQKVLTVLREAHGRLAQVLEEIDLNWARKNHLDMPVYLGQPETELGLPVLRIDINQKVEISTASLYRHLVARDGEPQDIEEKRKLMRQAVALFIQHSFRPAITKMEALVEIFSFAMPWAKAVYPETAPKTKMDWKKANREQLARLGLEIDPGLERIFGVA